MSGGDRLRHREISVGRGQDGGPRSIGQLVLPDVSQYYPRKTKMKKMIKGKPALALKLGKEGTQNPQAWISCCSQSRLSEEGRGGEGHGPEPLVQTHQTGGLWRDERVS